MLMLVSLLYSYWSWLGKKFLFGLKLTLKYFTFYTFYAQFGHRLATTGRYRKMLRVVAGEIDC